MSYTASATVMEIINTSYKFIDKVKGMKNTEGVISRGEIQPRFGYGIPDKSSIIELISKCQSRNIGKILSIGAGLGFVEYILKSLSSMDIISTDPLTSHGTDENIENKWMEIEKLGHKDALDKYGSSVDCLLMIWPAMEDWSYETVRIARDKGIQYIIYIGETANLPCTGTDQMLEELDTYWDPEEQIYFNTFYHINDSINLYKLK